MCNDMDDVLLTKLQCPPVGPDILPRDRLSGKLHEGCLMPLTLISAPAGYGKSTLAGRWVRDCERPYGWITLDRDDNDLRRFIGYLLFALQQTFPEEVLYSKTLVETDNLTAPEKLARYLLNDLHLIPEHFNMVLDDYQCITDWAIHDLISTLLKHPAENMHLILVTRHDPPLPITPLRANGHATDIRATDLRFTLSETRAFLNNKLDIQVDDTLVELLEKKIEGWPAGLRLASIYLRNQVDLEQSLEDLRGSSGYITEYLFEEVLEKQGPEITKYLIEASILDRFCAPLCQVMHRNNGNTGCKGISAGQFIDGLVEENLFTIALDNDGCWFRYHHLFREFLLGFLRKQLTYERATELHHLAAGWLSEKGLIEEAIHHTLAAGDKQAAVSLVLDHRYKLLNTSQFARLNRWITMLPENAVSEEPLLMTAKAFIGFACGPTPDAFTYTEQACQVERGISESSPDVSVLKGETAVLQSVLGIFTGEKADLPTNVQEAFKWLPENALYSRSLAIGAMAGYHQMEGDYDQCLKLMKEALTDPQWPESIRLRLWLYYAIMSVMEADSSGVLLSANEGIKFSESMKLAHPGNNALCYLGTIHYLRNELEEAKICLDRVVKNSDAAKGGYLAQAAGILAFIHLAEGHPKKAHHIIEQVTESALARQDGYAQLIMGALAVELALRHGQVDHAKSLSTGIDFDRFPPIYFHFVPQLTYIKLLIAQDTEQGLHEAHDRLTELDEQMQRINRRNVHIDVLALLAIVCRKSGDEASALKKLSLSLKLAHPGQWVRNFVDLGTPMTILLGRLVKARPDNKYAKHVLEVCMVKSPDNGVNAYKKNDVLTGEKNSGSFLTRRETEILKLLAEGLKNSEIAQRLNISIETVKTHLQNIYRKLEVKGRIGALKKAGIMGVI